MMPAISVLTPVYNCADTLGLALASLQTQSFRDWECIVVDDGSTDDPAAVVTAAGDIRIRYHHLDRNRGRGYARQKALEVAQGKYVCWLDGDDWIFPEKLETQLDLLLREPELAAVSTGMAVVNESLDLVGIRVSSNDSSVLHDRVRSVGGVPLVFAASMMRADLAKRTGFVSSYTLSEDTDFLLRALFGKPYAIINTPLYVYREVGCTSLANALASLNACCDIYWNFRRGRTLERLAAVAATRLKQVVYCGATAIGKWDYIIARRSRPPLESERQRYEDALHALMTSRQRNET